MSGPGSAADKRRAARGGLAWGCGVWDVGERGQGHRGHGVGAEEGKPIGVFEPRMPSQARGTRGSGFELCHGRGVSMLLPPPTHTHQPGGRCFGDYGRAE